uniref:DUF4942 domain-containing protein n=1 Tax=Strongyloides venezuelensis TaxID=75913 RepID=A0A0K0FWA3_STRVS
MPLKTNRELIEILEAMNFAMDMRMTIDNRSIRGRVDYNKSWKFKDLNIFLDGDIRKNNATIMNQTIEFTKGLVTAGLPRESVDYLVNKLNITTFLNQLNTDLYGNDELSWQTLLSSDILNVPGYVPRKHVMNYFRASHYLSKIVFWDNQPSLMGLFHYNICSWGVKTIKDLLNVEKYFLIDLEKNMIAVQ